MVPTYLYKPEAVVGPHQGSGVSSLSRNSILPVGYSEPAADFEDSWCNSDCWLQQAAGCLGRIGDHGDSSPSSFGDSQPTLAFRGTRRPGANRIGSVAWLARDSGGIQREPAAGAVRNPSAALCCRRDRCRCCGCHSPLKGVHFTTVWEPRFSCYGLVAGGKKQNS